MADKATIIEALRGVKDFDGGGDIVTRNRVQQVDVKNGVVKVTLLLPPGDKSVKERVEDACFDAVQSVKGVNDVSVVTTSEQQAPQGAAKAPPGNPFEGQSPIEGVKHIIAVASGKGGVGKSTVAVNLALALQLQGARVGLLDADVYGPSLQILLGVEDRPTAGKNKEVAPVEKDGIKLMSLGFLTDDDTPVIWRGPIVMGVIKKFLTDVEWGELDYLVIDLPPGTGDAQLTLVQTVPISGAIIVTTPSELAIVDAQKGLRMFEQVHAPVLGIVENMSTFVCPHCGEHTDIFDSNGAQRISEATGVLVLGQIPLDPKVRSGGDSGAPIVKSDPDSAVAGVFLEIGRKVMARFPVGKR